MILRKWVNRASISEYYAKVYSEYKNSWNSELNRHRLASMDDKVTFRRYPALITNHEWIANLGKESNKNMFSWIRGLFGRRRQILQELSYMRSSIKSLLEKHKEDIANLQEDLHIHRKLMGTVETKTICNPRHWNIGENLHDPHSEYQMQERRNEFTKDGFEYFHTKANGDEIWKKKSPT